MMIDEFLEQSNGSFMINRTIEGCEWKLYFYNH